MDSVGIILVTIGGLFLLGLLADQIGRRTPIPRVTLLLLGGYLIGPSAANLLPNIGDSWFPLVTNLALLMVGFLLGENLSLSSLKKYGKLVLTTSSVEVFITVTVIFVGFVLAGVPLEIALLFPGIAAATAPAATTDVVHELKASGKFTKTLLGIVAIDDAWGIAVFSIMLAIAETLGGHGGSVSVLTSGAWEIFGAILLGIVLGIPFAYLTGRIQPGEPTLVETLGLVMLCGGIAHWLDVSYLLASMSLGCVISNLAKHHTRPFRAIENVEWPFMVLFFVLAGAALELDSLGQMGKIAVLYIALRILGKILGGWTGGRLSGADKKMRRWIGLALLPQAGVALGLALIATQHFPDRGAKILSVVVGATVFFELFGPIMTRLALTRVGEAGKKVSEEDLMKSWTVDILMNRKVPCLHEDMFVQKVLHLFGESDTLALAVVDDNNKLQGIVTLDDIRRIFLTEGLERLVIARDLMQPVTKAVSPHDTVAKAKKIMDGRGIDDLPVVTSHNEFIGMLEYRTLKKRMSEAIKKLHLEGDKEFEAD